MTNAAPEVATIGQVARLVQRLAVARGLVVRIEGEAACEGAFEVQSSLDLAPARSLGTGLGEVLDYFLAQAQ